MIYLIIIGENHVICCLSWRRQPPPNLGQRWWHGIVQEAVACKTGSPEHFQISMWTKYNDQGFLRLTDVYEIKGKHNWRPTCTTPPLIKKTMKNEIESHAKYSASDVKTSSLCLMRCLCTTIQSAPRLPRIFTCIKWPSLSRLGGGCLLQDKQ